MRPSGRSADQLRTIKVTRQFTHYAEGSVLIECGNTKVICTASVEKNIPRWLKGTGRGWITAEYGMLPRSTGERNAREVSRERQKGRTMEIQRLIGRALRAAVDLKALGEVNIIIDCDVIQADGGTRTAAITGGCIALVDCLSHLKKQKTVTTDPLKYWVGAVSVGLYNDNVLVDLDYMEDSNAETDMNIVMTEQGDLVEIQGTAESGHTFSRERMDKMVALACHRIEDIIKIQKNAFEETVSSVTS